MLPVLGVVMVPLGLVDCAVATVARPSEDEAIRIIFEIFIKVLPKVRPYQRARDKKGAKSQTNYLYDTYHILIFIFLQKSLFFDHVK